MGRGKHKERNPFIGSNLKETRKQPVIVLEDLDFVWDMHELKELAKLWKEGTTIGGIAEHFERETDEILLALIHVARGDKISQRKGGLLLGV